MFLQGAPMSAFQGNVTPAQRDPQGFVNTLFQSSMAMIGDTQGGSNIIYIGFAKPGSDPANPVWQIKKLTWDGSGNVIQIQWPNDGTTRPTNDFRYIWNNRTSLTYS